MSSEDRQPTGPDEEPQGRAYTSREITDAVRKHNRRALERRRLEVDEPAARSLQAQMLALIEQFEEDRDAERRQFEAAGGTALDTLAEGFHRARSAEERHDLAEQVGSSLPLAEAGVIRRAAKALEGALPGVVVDARADGWTAAEIAAELGMSSPSYVHRILRDNPWEAAWILYRADDDAEDENGDPWQDVAHGTEESRGETADEVAARVLEERLDDELAAGRARVLVWRTGDGNHPNDARGEAEYPRQ